LRRPWHEQDRHPLPGRHTQPGTPEAYPSRLVTDFCRLNRIPRLPGRSEIPTRPGLLARLLRRLYAAAAAGLLRLLGR